MSHTPVISCVPHLSPLLTPKRLKALVPKLVKNLKKRNFDAIAFRGLSGAMIAPIVAMRLNKTLIAVRKGEKAHSCHTVEGDIGAKSYIILDDLIDSGATVRAIVEGIKEECNAEFVGFLGYCSVEHDDDGDDEIGWKSAEYVREHYVKERA
jgi:adenine/guanine phosphoribosyltransferase-like PRPP-binding protein